jgi:hypothetical protein
MVESPESSSARIPIPELSRAGGDRAREFAADSDIRLLVPLGAVPWLVVTYDDLSRMPLDPRAGFVVSLIDGKCSVDMLLDISGMREDETLHILRELVRLGAIELRDAT